jgi:hypothetical protein
VSLLCSSDTSALALSSCTTFVLSVPAGGFTGKAIALVEASSATIAAERRILNAGFAWVDLGRWLTHGLTDEEVLSYQKCVDGGSD